VDFRRAERGRSLAECSCSIHTFILFVSRTGPRQKAAPGISALRLSQYAWYLDLIVSDRVHSPATLVQSVPLEISQRPGGTLQVFTHSRKVTATLSATAVALR
jgi:hypothetical protein